MSDEVVGQDPEVVQPEVKEEVSVHAEETSPKPDESTQETGGEEKKHPLEPGGERFNQIYARGKEAERERDHYREESQREREERIRLEERLKALEDRRQEQPRLTWANYQSAIDAGQISQADAMARWTDQVKREAKEEAVREVDTHLRTTTRVATVTSEIDRYTKAIPGLNQHGSEDRVKVEQEFNYLVQRGADPKSLATEVAALRAAHGSIERVEQAAAAKRTTTREPFMETHSSTHKPQTKTTDPIKNLDEAKRKYYQNQIDKGRYADWKEVAEELTYKAPSLRYSRG